MTDIHIPPEALEAGRKAFTDAMMTVPQPDPIAAAFTAMVEAWPEMKIRTTFWPNDDGVWIVPRPALSLPLPQEKPDE